MDVVVRASDGSRACELARTAKRTVTAMAGREERAEVAARSIDAELMWERARRMGRRGAIRRETSFAFFTGEEEI